MTNIPVTPAVSADRQVKAMVLEYNKIPTLEYVKMTS